MKNVWQFMRDTWLADRVFQGVVVIVDHCCHHWNRLVDQPWRIMSIGPYECAHGFRSMGVGMMSILAVNPTLSVRCGPSEWPDLDGSMTKQEPGVHCEE